MTPPPPRVPAPPAPARGRSPGTRGPDLRRPPPGTAARSSAATSRAAPRLSGEPPAPGAIPSRMRRRNHAQRLRSAVEMLPERTRVAMLHGIDSNPIIVGAYSDGDGGICPMLAAHRNGGRTSVASFAKAWDAYTGARRPRRATRREVRTLRSYLEMSLSADTVPAGMLGKVVEEVRRDRRRAAERAAWETKGVDIITATQLGGSAEAASAEPVVS